MSSPRSVYRSFSVTCVRQTSHVRIDTSFGNFMMLFMPSESIFNPLLVSLNVKGKKYELFEMIFPKKNYMVMEMYERERDNRKHNLKNIFVLNMDKEQPIILVNISISKFEIFDFLRAEEEIVTSEYQTFLFPDSTAQSTSKKEASTLLTINPSSEPWSELISPSGFKKGPNSRSRRSNAISNCIMLNAAIQEWQSAAADAILKLLMLLRWIKFLHSLNSP